MTHAPSSTHRAGFSLVELAIVLAVIGLLTATVLVGMTMIESSKIRQTIALLKQYDASVRQFREQYGSWPGDFGRAEDIWGTETTLGGPGTRSGNENRSIGDGCWTGEPCETFRAFEHLHLAGLVETPFAGYRIETVDTTWGFYPGVNLPQLPTVDNGVLLLMAMDTRTVAAWSFLNTRAEAALYLHGTGSNHAALTVDQAMQIDMKFDDGQPQYGVFTVYDSPNNCVTGTYPAVSYNTANLKVRACIGVYTLDITTQPL